MLGSHMCKAFPELMTLSKNTRDEVKFQKLLKQGTDHLKFAFKLYEKQREKGRCFLHEHLDGATPWQLGLVKDLASKEDLSRVRCDQCAFNQTAVDAGGDG